MILVRRVFGNMVGAGLSDEDDVEDEEQAHFLINDEVKYWFLSNDLLIERFRILCFH